MTDLPAGPAADQASAGAITFDFAELTPRERYKLLIGAIVPRPIALVTTVDACGAINAAPFSFFNCLSSDPPILALGVERRAGDLLKDTSRNISKTGAFTVNIVSEAMVGNMNVCAIHFDPGVDELAQADLTAKRGIKVPCPWIAESPAAFECRHHSTIPIGSSGEIVLGEVVLAHFRSDAVDVSRFNVDPAALDAIGRIGGRSYSTTRERFDLPTATLDGFRDDPMAAYRKI